MSAIARLELVRTPRELDATPEFRRYMALVTAVNGVRPERFPFEWLAEALCASALPAC